MGEGGSTGVGTLRKHALSTSRPFAMIAVRPPEYFPRLEYVALLQHVDHFILADTFPYRRQTFQNRSKLRSPQGWHWITIPIFGRRDGAPLRDVEIKTGGRWLEKHWRSFLYNYRTTMYFEFLEDSFRPFFEQSWERLSPCIRRSVELLAELFGIGTPITCASQLDGAPASLGEVVQATEADALVVPKEHSLPDLTGTIATHTFAYDHPTYHQNFDGFESGMTAADLVFNYGREAQRILATGTKTTPAEHPSHS